MIDTNIDFIIEGDTIDLVTDFGQTVTEIKSPETYTGQTTVTPSTTQQILQTKNKLVTENITVEGVPLGILDVTENGTYHPVDVLGFSEVNVNTGIKAITGKFEITKNLAWTEAIETSIHHGLGAVPSMIVIWTHNNDEARNGNRTIIATWINKDEFNFPWSQNCLNPFVERWILNKNTDANLSLATPTNPILGLKYLPTATEFHLIEPQNTGTYKVGTYYYLLVAGNWEQYADDNSGNVTV